RPQPANLREFPLRTPVSAPNTASVARDELDGPLHEIFGLALERAGRRIPSNAGNRHSEGMSARKSGRLSLGYFSSTAGFLPAALRAACGVRPRSCAARGEAKRSDSVRPKAETKRS